ncbi:hypothetical protein MBM_02999 [Drepanopeziza brunnea f. sp. 'multigermtubi' MB_m1]|uniref:Uncharacterized protein n=1 Tax=Marssonina brunnea f. sp. multigermtubi (strain MB_m1) TaxID=1072389 RepID=K1X172_MARBU|nr:uncharacterized protein MBM_02999 [Drepanopeziza brunnea f. sp. 'multigermtubi' MB_m1]EKD18757.1 hypothetical protein MBM_02999 [Drepanopeziza brunnea f. sp. 'multigermtubi' MB_m1]
MQANVTLTEMKTTLVAINLPGKNENCDFLSGYGNQNASMIKTRPILDDAEAPGAYGKPKNTLSSLFTAIKLNPPPWKMHVRLRARRESRHGEPFTNVLPKPSSALHQMQYKRLRQENAIKNLSVSSHMAQRLFRFAEFLSISGIGLLQVEKGEKRVRVSLASQSVKLGFNKGGPGAATSNMPKPRRFREERKDRVTAEAGQEGSRKQQPPPFCDTYMLPDPNIPRR